MPIYRFKEVIIHSEPEAYKQAKDDLKKFQEEGYEIFSANGVYAPDHQASRFEKVDYVIFYFLRKRIGESDS